MSQRKKQRRQREARLWALAFIGSVIGNLFILVVVGIGMQEVWVRESREVRVEEGGETERVVTVMPEVSEKPAVEEQGRAKSEEELRREQERERLRLEVMKKKAFVRTSEEQEEVPWNRPSVFIGERSTQATSDRKPEREGVDAMPAQKGVLVDEFETTESRYQDGELKVEGEKGKVGEGRVAMDQGEGGKDLETQVKVEAESKKKEVVNEVVKQEERIWQGPVEVEVPAVKSGLVENKVPEQEKVVNEEVAKADGVGESIKEEEGKKESEGKKDEIAQDEKKKKGEKVVEAAKDAKVEFKGNQRKAIILGSIKRTGTSALDVENSALGRYCAVISKAVELEFQRNCVRHRDYITPGFLTVRFFVEPSGKVRSCVLDGEVVTGEIQKGFTLNSIRNAGIPAMPKSLKEEYKDKPLELVFRFYF